MSTVLGCIADDFTGATDLAGILARSGIGVSLRIGVPADDAPGPPAPFEVIALKCRTTPADEAVRDTGAALAWLRRCGARRFYWKYCSTFDSTARGNIGPVAEALMHELGSAQTIYCPAFPENGRTVYQGRLFVGDVPLDESPMKDHPLTPMRDASLERLLAPQVRGRVGAVYWHDVSRSADVVRERLGALAADGVAHVVVDAIRDDDLRCLAEACLDMDLVTGGSALAMALPELYRRNGELGGAALERSPPAVGGGELVLSGSCSAMTRAQVKSFCARAPSLKLDPVALAGDFEGTLAAATRWLDGQRADQAKIVYATAEPKLVEKAQTALGRERAGEIVERAMATLATYAFEHGVRRLVVAGGETAGAVTQALGVTRLDIGEEIAPGVPWTFATRDGTTLALALKSGNFGGEAFFSDAFSRLP